MVRRALPNRHLRRAVEQLERKRLYGEPKPEEPMYFKWEDVMAIGADIGTKVGTQLAEKYIRVLEEAWGSKPTDKKDLTVACKWIMETALEEAFTQPPWDSLKTTRLFYPASSREAGVLDMRVWQVYERAVIQTVHKWLVDYGCKRLRFLDMSQLAEYYRSLWRNVSGPGPVR